MKRLVLAICVAALAFGCFEKSNPTGGGGGGTPPAGTVKIISGTLSVSGSTITTTITSTECDDTSLVTSTETSVQTFTVTATTLIITDSSGTDTLTRVGTGTGLQGTWTMTEPDLGGQAYMVVGASTIEMWIPTSFLMTMMKEGLLGEIDNPGITVDTSNPAAFKMTGKTTNEVVTLTINGSAQIVWSSSVAAHTTLTATVFNPTDCDAPIVPDWLTDFIAGNATAAKNMAKTVDMKTLEAAIFSNLHL